MKPWLRNAIGAVLVLLGLAAMNLGSSSIRSQRTEGNQTITDVSYGLESSPLYVFHKAEPTGGADLAIARGESIRVVINRGTHWLSWSALLLAAGLSAIASGLMLLMRKPKDEPTAR